MRRIKLRLNPQSADDAIRDVLDFRKYVITASIALGEALVSEGIELVKLKILEYDAFETGQLLGSVDGFFDPLSGKGVIQAKSGHAAFVEYGTGIVGATNHSVEPKPSDWQHDVNNHGDDGWFYANGRWTKGMPPRPFMWEAWLELCNKTNELVKEKFHG